MFDSIWKLAYIFLLKATGKYLDALNGRVDSKLLSVQNFSNGSKGIILIHSNDNGSYLTVDGLILYITIVKIKVAKIWNILGISFSAIT